MAGRRCAVAGAWPRPGHADLEVLDRALADAPPGAVTLVDGLVACAAPEVVVPQAERLRLVVLVHLPLADETGLAPALAADLDARERETLRAAAVAVATSAAVGRRLLGHHGLDGSRVRVAPPGVDPAPAAPARADGGRLACVASVTPRKGHDVLVEALARLEDLAWRCVCAGPLDRDAGHGRAVVREVAERGFADRVRFVGALEHRELDALYAATDVLVLPSRAEPYGMVLTEALARGLPAVASDVGGVREALGRGRDGGLPGLLVPAGDDALADALRAWITDAGLRRRLRAAAAERRATLGSWEETTRTVAAVLREVAG